MIGRVNHIAIAVPDVAGEAERYRAMLGAKVGDRQVLPEHGVVAVFIDTGNTKVELLEPLGADSPIAGFLKRHPQGGLHHICYEVEDIGRAARSLKDAGARVLGEPKIGAHGNPVLFIHPAELGGVLTELEEVRSK